MDRTPDRTRATTTHQTRCKCICSSEGVTGSLMRATRPALIMIATLFSIVVIGESSTEPTRALPMSPKFSLLIRPTCMNALIDIPIVARGSIAGEFGTSTNITQRGADLPRWRTTHTYKGRISHVKDNTPVGRGLDTWTPTQSHSVNGIGRAYVSETQGNSNLAGTGHARTHTHTHTHNTQSLSHDA
jgi:hypothetical protein